MFLPTEPFLLIAMTEMPDLWEYAMSKHIMLCSPMMLMPILRMFASDWQMQQQDEHAREVAKLGSELYERLANICYIL